MELPTKEEFLQSKNVEPFRLWYEAMQRLWEKTDTKEDNDILYKVECWMQENDIFLHAHNDGYIQVSELKR